MKKLLLFGIGMFVTFFALGTLSWFLIDKPNKDVVKYSETYDPDKFNKIEVDSNNVSIHLKKGKRFKFKYQGSIEPEISTKNGTFKLNDEEQKLKGRANFNPFDARHKHLTITVPPKKLKEIDLSTATGEVVVDGASSKSLTIWNSGTGKLDLSHLNCDSADIKGKRSALKLDDSHMKDTSLNIDAGEINVTNSLIQSGIVVINSGPLRLNKMHPDTSVKASSKRGNIYYSYDRLPKSVKLKLSPENGKMYIKNEALRKRDDKYSKHILEFYTHDGDIKLY
ncbi:DUF4097 domain-containing protein [Staphylococcus massiliensis]|uniref:DUF4097 family beta strand repeat-containing protein n=1 Tax=Staphylococcus massiliensis TaxID=555791 RepID=UPI001EE03B7C|nr:DUF4097 family beta strand repeat-containing protein [Staphylococcus massiliensis]MCG3402629.1 DUF4097 domain-containing protein [Staphylococcus massiliensis]